MIQIIALMGCFYLLVKALEIAGRRDSCNAEGQLSPNSLWAIVLCWIGAIGFAVWILFQGLAIQQATSETVQASQSMISCINSAATQEEMLACR